MPIKPYSVEPDATPLAELLERCNGMCFPFSQPQGLSSLMAEYERLLDTIGGLENVELAPLREMQAPIPPDKVRVMIRHDVDHDLPAAVEMARMEQARRIPAAYYIHHASPYYYGLLDDDGVFHRFEAAAECYREIQDSGAEVGLHADPFGFYQQGVDGSAALKTELNWLRSQGLEIRGTAAHGSAPYCGAENFEIFADRRLGGPDQLTLGGEAVALGALSEKELGLEYEANFATAAGNRAAQRDAYLAGPPADDEIVQLRTYLHDNPHARWGQDFTAWARGRGRWVLASTDPDGIYNDNASLVDLSAFLEEAPAGSTVVLHVHPCYFGFRLGPESGPVTGDLAEALYAAGGALHALRLSHQRLSGDVDVLAQTVADLRKRLGAAEEQIEPIYRRYDAARRVVRKVMPKRPPEKQQ